MMNSIIKHNINETILIRNIKKDDYTKKYLYLLKQLTSIDPEKISNDDFNNLVDKLNNDHIIIVIEDITTATIIASATLFVEYKFIHNMGKVGHIEDVVVDKEYRGHGFGILMIDNLINLAKERKCYKVILDCSESNVCFYEKCGFVKKEVEMVKYIDE